MLGGAHLDQMGLRAVPSLRYLDNRPRFSRHQYATTSDDAEDVGPGGGFMWDGRADSLEAQALLPLLDPREMGNHDVHALAARLRSAREAPRMRALFGAAALRNDAHAATLVGRALARFELEDPSFHPFDSRYDAYLRGTERLSAQELHGLQLFLAPAKGNCAECHPASSGPGGRPPQFTDHRFAALAVPRNPQLTANRDASFHDLGLCGPLRSDLVKVSAEYCGLFKTPSLRNAGRRAQFFHNGRFSTLEDVVRFYVQRDLEPQHWYAHSPEHVQRYDDLPSLYRVNVDRYDPPFDQHPGQTPVLSESEIRDLVAFLYTLNDRS
jgi:cytochrome c peroxidase